MLVNRLRFLEKRYSWLLIGWISLSVLFFISKAWTAPLSDFAGYYFGAKMWQDGLFNISVYFTSDFNFIVEKVYHVHTYVSYTPFPPFTAIVFSPFTVFPVVTAKLAFNLFSGILLVWLVLRLVKYFELKSWAVMLLPLVFYIPLKNNFSYGQGYILLMFLLFEGYLAFEKGNRFLGSLCWSFAFLFKIFPCILVFLLIKKRDWRSFGFLAITGSIMFGLSFWTLGKDVWIHYLSIMPRLSYGELNDPFAVSFQSLFMFLKNSMVYDTMFNPNPLINSPLGFDLSWIMSRALIISVLLLWKSKTKNENFGQFAVWMLATLLLSPNGSTYSLLALFFVFFWLISRDSSDLWWIIGLIGITCNFPLHILKEMPIYLQFPKLIGLIILLVFLFALSQKIGIRHLALTIFISIMLFMVKSRTEKNIIDPSQFVNKKPSFDLPRALVVWNQSVWVQTCKEEKWEFKPLYMVPFGKQDVIEKYNQLYFKGIAITKGTDFKRSPIQISEDKVLYLSDQGQGIGFFVPKILQFH